MEQEVARRDSMICPAAENGETADNNRSKELHEEEAGARAQGSFRGAWFSIVFGGSKSAIFLIDFPRNDPEFSWGVEIPAKILPPLSSAFLPSVPLPFVSSSLSLSPRCGECTGCGV